MPILAGIPSLGALGQSFIRLVGRSRPITGYGLTLEIYAVQRGVERNEARAFGRGAEKTLGAIPTRTGSTQEVMATRAAWAANIKKSLRPLQDIRPLDSGEWSHLFTQEGRFEGLGAWFPPKSTQPSFPPDKLDQINPARRGLIGRLIGRAVTQPVAPTGPEVPVAPGGALGFGLIAVVGILAAVLFLGARR